MCGICGEIARKGQTANTARVEAMCEAMVARGPDGSGIYRHNRVALGHHRLKIIDLSEAASQPMSDNQLGLSIVFNGAIYNYRELREELSDLGYCFFSHGDTEVILKAYHAWGVDCVKRFNGMFALAIVERDTGRVFLARDRLGIKPLYLAEILPNGYINARHLDDKAGVAVLLAFRQFESKPPVTLHVLFTISEEVGSGASAVLSRNVAEMVSIDHGTCGPRQNSRECGVTVAMADSSGPFDYHLTHHLINLCQSLRLPYQRDIFRYYRCDSASALEAGNDIRTALLAFGVDSSHGYERTHLDALVCLAQLCLAYAESPMFDRSKNVLMSDLAAFPPTRKVDLKTVLQQESDSLIQRPPKPKVL